MFRFRRPPPPALDDSPLAAELAREVRRLQVLTRRRVSDLFAGEYHSAFKGQGIEFSEVREYEPGDDIRAIDWNVTARAGKPFIKRFVEERQLTVVVAVDLSASGAFGTRGRTKRRLEVEAAAVLAMAATQNQDRVGLQLFTDRVEKFIPPSKGGLHCQRLLRDMLAFEPMGSGTDVAAAIDHLSRVLTRRSVVFIISDFDSAPYIAPMRVLARKHDVVAVTVTDPSEADLPNVGLIDVVDPETGRARLIDTSGRGRRAYAAWRAQRRQERDQTLASTGVDHIDLYTNRPFVQEIAAYFRRRERRR